MLLTVREFLVGPLQRGHHLRLCGQFRLWFLRVISADKNLYHCFGCDAGGSVLDWLLHTERLRFLQGILWLRQLNGTTYVRPASSPLWPVRSSPIWTKTDRPCHTRSPTSFTLTCWITRARRGGWRRARSLVVPVVGWLESYDPQSRGRVLQLYGRRARWPII